MLNTYEIAKEATAIVRGEHPGWEGDRIANFEGFCFRIRSDFPAEEVAALAADIEANATNLSDEFGASPNRYRIMARELRGGR